MSASSMGRLPNLSKKCCSFFLLHGNRIAGWSRSSRCHHVVPDRCVPTPMKSGGPVTSVIGGDVPELRPQRQIEVRHELAHLAHVLLELLQHRDLEVGPELGARTVEVLA